MVIRAALAALAAAVLPAAAFSPGFPVPATLTADQAETPGDYLLPLAPWAGGHLPVLRVDGQVTRRAWRLEAPGQTTLALLAPLRAALVEQGYTILLDCATEACGGFDFRFATPVLPEPGMHVDLGDFRFLSARRDTGLGVQAVGLLVSRSATAGHVQIVTVDPLPPAEPAPEAPPDAPPEAGAADPLAQALRRDGFAVLEDLAFATGSAELAGGDIAALTALAAMLAADPGMRLALVGHTDAAGGLEANIALSRARAAAVRDRLVALGADPARVVAEGVGWLAPRATNLTEEGRQKNRRVEAVLASTR